MTLYGTLLPLRYGDEGGSYSPDSSETHSREAVSRLPARLARPRPRLAQMQGKGRATARGEKRHAWAPCPHASLTLPGVCAGRVPPRRARASEESRLLRRFSAGLRQLAHLRGDIGRGRCGDPADPHQATGGDVGQGEMRPIRRRDVFGPDRHRDADPRSQSRSTDASRLNC